MMLLIKQKRLSVKKTKIIEVKYRSRQNCQDYFQDRQAFNSTRIYCEEQFMLRYLNGRAGTKTAWSRSRGLFY